MHYEDHPSLQSRLLTLGLESLEDVREDADAPEPGDAVGVELGHRVPDDTLLLRFILGGSVLLL